MVECSRWARHGAWASSKRWTFRGGSPTPRQPSCRLTRNRMAASSSTGAISARTKLRPTEQCRCCLSVHCILLRIVLRAVCHSVLCIVCTVCHCVFHCLCRCVCHCPCYLCFSLPLLLVFVTALATCVCHCPGYWCLSLSLLLVFVTASATVSLPLPLCVSLPLLPPGYPRNPSL